MITPRIESDGVYLDGDDGTTVGPFGDLLSAEEFLDWMEFKQQQQPAAVAGRG